MLRYIPIFSRQQVPTLQSPVQPTAPTIQPTSQPGQSLLPSTPASQIGSIQNTNFTPSPNQSLPASFPVSDFIRMSNLLNPQSNTSGAPKAVSYTISDLARASSAMQAQYHPGYSGSITGQTHVSDPTQGNMPKGYDPSKDFHGFYASQCTSYASWYWSNVLGKPFVDLEGLGNAKNWPELAQKQGYSVHDTPQPGDIVSWPNMGTYGHVAIVQKVNSDGTMSVSEMNYVPNKYTTRDNVSAAGGVFIR